MWYVYFLELRNGDIYVGSTNDLRRRVAAHQQGHVISTRNHLTGRRLARLVFWLPALQLVFGGLQLPGPGFVAPALAVYLVIRLRRAKRDVMKLMSSSLGPSLRLRRNEPQLLHDGEAVHQVPGLNDAAIRIEAMHIPECRLNLPVGGCCSHHRFGVRRCRRASPRDPVTLRNSMLDNDHEVRPALTC